MAVISSNATDIKVRLYAVGTSATDAFNSELFADWKKAVFAQQLTNSTDYKVYTTTALLPIAELSVV